MQKKERNGVQWLEFDLLKNMPKVQHGIFLRHGGHSEGPYGSLNLGDHVGDDFKHVTANQKKISDLLQTQHLTWSKQCHGIAINEITTADSPVLSGDALVTKKLGIGLMVHHADCQAAIMYDPVHHAVANVHSGWRGNVQNIYAAAINYMQHTHKTNPKDLLVCISPSLGPDHAQFVNYRKELPESFWDFQVKPDYFDLWEISKMQLTACGVLPKHIEIASICTYANPKDYFSYRRNNVTGRHGTAVVLR